MIIFMFFHVSPYGLGKVWAKPIIQYKKEIMFRVFAQDHEGPYMHVFLVKELLYSYNASQII